MERMRLQKFLAESGVASRRKAEEMIRNGRVKVNGVIVAEMGVKVSQSDAVEVDGKRVEPETRKVYIMLHKPVGFVTTVTDQFERKTVLDLVRDIRERVYPAGRLDYDTSGLLILTNDGDFAYRLTHPKHEVEKVYIAELRGMPDEEDMAKFRHGLKIEDYITAPADITIIKKNKETSIARILIHEGRNRQVRKMCEAIGHPVISLKRTAIGRVKLGELPSGQWRYLTDEEIRWLGKIGEAN